MKKFFSAILLMTMMVFSVGTFVSCNDLVNEIEGVKTQTTELEAAIAELEGDLATLETALQNAKKEAADAAAAADANAKDAAAAAAAAQAKVDAVEAALAEAKATLETALAGKADTADVEAAVKDIEALQTALAGKADATDVEALKKQAELLEATLAEYKTLLDNLGLEDKKLQDAYADLEARLQQTLSDMQAADEANAEAIADLVKDLEEAVAAVNENLVSYDDTLKAIVDMIQSVVYVPEYVDGEMTATGYVLGNKASDIIVKATYEVTPAAAAAELTNANLKFQAVNLLATRAAAAETVAAELVEPAANGRVTVYARIKKGQNIYKQLTTNNKAALALVVTDQESVVIDSTDYAAGTNYKTAYTTVRPYDADSFVELNTLVKSYNNVTGKWVKGEQVYGVYDNENTLQVPYTDTEVKSPLAIYELRADIQGKAMTIAEAAAFVGYDLKVKPAAETIEYLVADSKPQPFKVVPGNFATTVQLVGREGNELKDFAEAGYGVTVTIPSYTVNDATCAAVPVSGTVIITYAKDSDIKFESYDAGAWSYDYYKTLGRHAYVKNSPVCELDVTSNVNIRDLYYGDIELKDGAEFEVKMTAHYFNEYNQPDYEEGYATFKVLNSKSVMLNAIDLPIIDQALTYTANFTLKDKDAKLTYTASFTATVGARPADKEISLGDLTYTGKIKGGVAAPVQPINLVLAQDASFYGDILSQKIDAKVATLNAGIGQPTDAEAAKLTKSVYSNVYGNLVETANVTVASVNAYGTKYNVKSSLTFYGINYTFTGSLTVNKPNYGIKASSLLINPSTMVGDVAGKVVYPAKATGGDVSKGTFTLQAIDLRDYVVVTKDGANALEDLLDSGEFELKYELISKHDGDRNPYTPDVVIPGFKFNGTEQAGTNPYVQLGSGLRVANTVTWPTRDYASAKFRVTLVATNGAKVETADGTVADDFGFVEFTLQIPDLVTMAPTSKVETKEFVPGVDQVAVINVYKSITVVDFNGTKLVGKKAKSLTTLWDETEGGKQFQMYGQSVSVINTPSVGVVPTAVVESTGDELYYGKDFEVDTTTGDVKLLATDLNIQSNVVVTVPLMLIHDYQDATDKHVVSVQVKFTPKK